MTRVLILALVLCGLAASAAHAGSKPGIASGANAPTRTASAGGHHHR
jgi:hypothetical protein